MLPAAHWIARIASEGYAIIPGLIDVSVIDQLNADLDPHFAAQPFSDGAFYGERTRRFGGLLNRSPAARALVEQATVLQIVDALLGPWCDRVALNLTQGIEIHPDAPVQLPHRDQDMWGGPKGTVEYLVNVMWPLFDFTMDNGATLLWPGSHCRQNEALLPMDDAVAAEMPPGSALLFLGSTLHGGGANLTSTPRRGIIISYCLGWLKPFENQWLVYPPEVACNFDPELAALIGYAQHRPNLGNVEGRCPSELLHRPREVSAPARDALRPDQQSALDAWVAGGRRFDAG